MDTEADQFSISVAESGPQPGTLKVVVPEYFNCIISGDELSVTITNKVSGASYIDTSSMYNK